MKIVKNALSCLLACCVLIASMPTYALAISTNELYSKQETVAAASSSNRCGENLTWQYENHTLTISGTGDMTDWSAWEDAPWAILGDDIRQIIIEKGVASIGDYGFSGCPNLQRVYLPVSVTSIGIKGLNNSGRFSICYEGDRFDWEKIEKYEYGENISLAPDSYAFLATGTVNTYYSDPIVFDDSTDTNVNPSEGFGLSDEQLSHVKQALGVPESLDVQVSVGDRRTYWDAAGIWLIDISFYYNGEMVAGALFDADTLELGRNITMYSGNTDIPSAWAIEEVENARNAGIIPDHLDSQYQDNITREEFCEIAAALVESRTGETMADVLDQKELTSRNPFSDTSNSDVIAMNALGVVNGTGGGRFSPNDEITREEAATMLTRLGEIMNLSGPESVELSFSDAGSISDWAYDAVGFVSSCKDPTNNNYVMGGTGENRFSPKDPYTREQAFVSFMRLYNAIGSCSIDQMQIGGTELVLYAGPGTDYASLGNIQTDEIDAYILEEDDWIEVDYGRGYGYVQEGSLNDLDKTGLPYVSQTAVVGPTQRPNVLYFDDLTFTLTDEVNVYSGADSDFGVRDTLEIGNKVTVLREVDGDGAAGSVNPFVLIEYDGEKGKSRGYALRNLLLDVDNPLRGFDEVKNNNAAFSYDGKTYYSTSAYPNALDGWASDYSESITQIRFNFINAVTGAIASNDGSDTVLKNELWLYDAKANAAVKTDVSTAAKDVGDAFVNVLTMVNAALASGNESIALKVDLETCGDEGRMLIRGGTPFESPKSGKANISLASLIAQSGSAMDVLTSADQADKMIRALCPEITGSEKCSMSMTFSDEFSDNPYGYYYIIGADGAAYAQLIIHPGTQFLVYQGTELIGDLAPRLSGTMMELDDETTNRILEVLAENGIKMQ